MNETMTDKTTIDAIALMKDKIERRDNITEDDRRLFLIALNKILANWLQQQ